MPSFDRISEEPSSTSKSINTMTKLEKPASTSQSRSSTSNQASLETPHGHSSRASSADEGSHPGSPSSVNLLKRAKSPRRNEKRRSWLPGSSRGDSPSIDKQDGGPRYWWINQGRREAYDPLVLASSVMVPELWDERGDTLIYLSTPSIDRPPAFRVNSHIFAASAPLMLEAHGSKAVNRQFSIESSMSSLSLETPYVSHTRSYQTLGPSIARSSSGPDSRSNLLKLYFPVLKSVNTPATLDEIEMLLSVRNLFAFLTCQPLVCSPKHATNLHIFEDISESLGRYEFTNQNGSSFGEVVGSSMAFYIQMLRLRDVRKTPLTTVEGVVIGELMKSKDLYGEAFVHGVGRWEELTTLPDTVFHQISRLTRNRMERAHMDLRSRIKTVEERLTNFEFPSLFVGVGNQPQAKHWKSSFLAFRKHVLSFYKDQYGSWPPKMSIRHHSQTQGSGLNRIVLQLLYRDLTELYDLLVDRKALTTRSIALTSHHQDPSYPATATSNSESPIPKALRRVMSEYDRSSPPVQPPIPYDTPLLPPNPSISPVSHSKPSGKLKGSDLQAVLTTMHNPTSLKKTLFIQSFLAFEQTSAHNATLSALSSLRTGHWIFLYACLQTLPLLVIDAPDLHYTQGVEYFLCEPPKGGAPWALASERGGQTRGWYGISGGSGVVSLPSDIVDHGIEGIYRRSHCWRMAERWSTLDSDHAPEPPLDPTPPFTAPFTVAHHETDKDDRRLPRATTRSAASCRGSSPGSEVDGRMSRDSLGTSSQPGLRHSSIFLGLEQLPVPHGLAGVGVSDGMGGGVYERGSVSTRRHGGQRQRAGSMDPTRRFEDILVGVPTTKGEKDRKK